MLHKPQDLSAQNPGVTIRRRRRRPLPPQAVCARHVPQDFSAQNPGVTIRRRRRRPPHRHGPEHQGADAAPAQPHPLALLTTADSSSGQPILQTAAPLQLPYLQDTLAGIVAPDCSLELPKDAR